MPPTLVRGGQDSNANEKNLKQSWSSVKRERLTQTEQVKTKSAIWLQLVNSNKTWVALL